MEAKYYVAVRPRINETHSVHKEGCPFLSDDDKRIYLGIFRSGQEALKEGQNHFLNSSRCPFCAKDINGTEDHPGRNDSLRISRISVEIMPAAYNQSLFCCIN